MSLGSQQLSELSDRLGAKIQRCSQLSGASSAACFLLECHGRDRYFLKYDAAATGCLTAEACGLDLIRASGSFRVPQIFFCSDRFLVSEFIDHAGKNQIGPKFWQKFAESLYCLHQCRGPHWGLDRDNFIGKSRQYNRVKAASWSEFFVAARLRPQLSWLCERGFRSKILIDEADRLIERVQTKLARVREQAVLVHGDLWSGNYLVDSDGNPVLIDPAVYFGHREAEFSIMHLFGGFSQLLWSEYQRRYPFEEGYEQRQTIYTLYHLLNHANIFGSSYLGDCEMYARRILDSYDIACLIGV